MFLIASTILFAAAEEFPHWPPRTFGMAVLSVVTFTLIGVAASVLGFKIWDWCTPGNLDEEIIKKQNMAAAVIGASIILGVCIIVAAALIG